MTDDHRGVPTAGPGCAGCGHPKDVHQRYVRNLNCCYDCHCKRFEPVP